MKSINMLKSSVALHGKAARIWYSRYPKLFWSILLCALTKAVVPYINIWLSAQIINELAGIRNSQRLWMLVTVTIIADVVLALLIKALERARAVEDSWWLQKYREEKYLNEKMMRMDYSIFEKQQTKDLRTRIGQDAQWCGHGIKYLNQMLYNCAEGGFRVIGAVLLTWELFGSKVPREAGWLTCLNHPLMLFVMAVILFAATILTPFCSAKAMSFRQYFGENINLINRIFEFIMANLQNQNRSLDVRMYEQEYYSNYHVDQVVKQFTLKTSSFARFIKGPVGFYHAAGAVISVIFTGIVYLFVCVKAWAGAFGIGSVTQYVASITAMSSGLGTFLKALGEMENNMPTLQKTFEFLEMPNVMYQGSLTTEKRSDKEYEVEFRDVSFRYPGSDNYVLRHVNINFKVGQRLAVVGENGSGKTTFIKLLCRLYDPTEGMILLNGIDIRKYNYQDYISIFAAVFQDFQLLAFPLGENVAASQHYDREKVMDCLDKAGFGNRISEMEKGLDSCLYREFEEDGIQISGGEAQKIAIARALYKNAPFIILDEPTAALDPIAEYEIYSKFNEIVEDKTAIYISHRLSSCRFCDSIAVFDQGHIVQTGTHEELVGDADGKYYELWNAQAQYYTETA